MCKDRSERILERARNDLVHPNSLGSNFTINQDGNITGITFSKGSSTIESLSYGRDPLGLVSNLTQSGSLLGNSPVKYSYSQVNRLTKANSLPYSYDQSGNMISMGTSSLAYNAGSELLSLTSSPKSSGTETFAYDANGNRTSSTSSSGQTTSYTYNGENELSSLNSNGTTSTYPYGGDGFRLSATSSGSTQSFVYDTQSFVPQLLEDGTNDYIYGPSGEPIEQISQSSGVPSYLFTDQLGSVVMEANQSGNITATQSHSPYGSVSSTTGTWTTPFGFAGESTDANGLIYLINRFYDPATGQFMSVDPLVRLTGAAYSYVGGDPVYWVDPVGLHKFRVSDSLSWLGCVGNFTDAV